MTSSAVLADLAEREPADAIVGLNEVVARARHDGDSVAEAEALNELGRARRALGQVDLAEHSLRAAIDVAPPGHRAAADAHLVLASVLSIGGRNDEAFGQLDLAGRTSDPALARSAELQRATLLQRTGRLIAARDIFERILPNLRADGLRSDTARVLANCGEIHTRLGYRDLAEDSYREAASTFGEIDQPVRQAQVLLNLGWMYGQWGELDNALRTLDDARERLAGSRLDVGSVELSRAEALMIAGLDREALAVAVDAVDLLLDAGCDAEAARGLLLAAAVGHRFDAVAASAHAARAAAMFADHGAASWRLRARLEAMRAAPCVHEIEALIIEMDDQQVSALEAHTLAASAALPDDPDAARRHLRRARALLRDDTPPSVEFDVALTDVRLAASLGDDATVVRCAGAALDRLLDRIATYGGQQRRSAFRPRMRELQYAAVAACVAIGDPVRAVDFSEHARRIELGLIGQQAPAGISAQQAALRAVASQVDELDADHGDADELRARSDQLRRSIAASVTTAPARTAPACDVQQPIVCLLDDGDQLYAVRWPVGQGSPTRIGSTADLRAAAAAVATTLAAAARSGRDVSRVVDRQLDVIEAMIGPTLRGWCEAGVPLGITAPSWLATVPWRLLPSLRHAAVHIVPSIGWLTHRVGTTSRVDDDADANRRAVVVAGPRLEHAEAEALAVAASYRSPLVLVGDAATPAAVRDALGSAGTLHVAAHGRFDRGNPEWSTIELAGGSMTVNELHVGGATPSTVVLSSCHTAPQTGDDLLGFAGALIASGTSAVIAASGPLPDTVSTASTMAALHRRLAAGMLPSIALAETCAAADDGGLADGMLVSMGAS